MPTKKNKKSPNSEANNPNSMKTKAKLLLPRDLSFTHLPDCELITPNSIENCKKQKRKRWLIYPQAEDPDTQQQAYRMRTQKNTSIKKNKKLPTDPKTNRDLKLGYQSKQPQNLHKNFSLLNLHTKQNKNQRFWEQEDAHHHIQCLLCCLFLKKCNRICACEDVPCPFLIGLLKTLKNGGCPQTHANTILPFLWHFLKWKFSLMST